MRKIFWVFTILAFPLFLGAEINPALQTIPVVDEAASKEVCVAGVSVGPHDEVAVILEDGSVFLYDAQRTFIKGYKFPEFSSGVYNITFDKEADIIYLFLPKLSKLYSYNGDGHLTEKTTVEGETAKYRISNRENRMDSTGAEYRVEKGDVIKVFADGQKEIFFYGYKDFRIDMGGLTAILFVFLGTFLGGKRAKK